jgi:hypothetical protein
VMRMSILRQIAPFNSYHWADRTFVAELALHGPFHNEPDFLYFRRDHPMRTSRLGRNNIRLRCSRLDPARANRWRHPLVRLMGEYVLGFVSAVRRAPLSARDRRRCMKEIALWLASHANPRHQRQALESPETDVLAEGAASQPTDPSVLVSAHREPATALEHRKGDTQ